LRDRLAALLERRGVPRGGLVEHHATLTSTNDRLRELCREGAGEWSVVAAEAQSAGRGRGGHVWESPAGNLFVSVLLRPRLPPNRVTLLPLLAGTSVAEALEEWGVPSTLKWPNDVLAGDRKLAGVLVESTSGATGVDTAIVGIGVNVMLDPSSLGSRLAERTASLVSVTGSGADPLEVAAAVLARLAVWYHALRDGRAEAVIEAWRARSVPWWGREIEIWSEGRLLEGRLEGIDESGALLLRPREGAPVRVLSGEDARLASTVQP
jgi:BirA family transcriptional regulator, biotin operon repressor / biotin---[acetyl-CoA-carboxylase] ligase